MDNFIVSARKYRPNAFREVVGQSHITDTLERAIGSNHLAQAMLFCGPRGVGKTTCARIVAKMINEVSGGNPDQDYSLNIFELDAASNNSVDDIRNLIDQVRFAPQVGEYKVYIIDEVHMLSQAAFNAFLKTLEEPPKHAIFILATTEKHKIIPTILSRCQIFDFKRIGVEDIAKHLAYVAEQEKINYEPEALHTIALKADGALRDSLSIFDRIVSFSDSEITYKAVIENLNILDYDYYFKTIDLVLDMKSSGLFMLFNQILEKGFDGHLFINGLASHVRDLLVCKDPQTATLLEVTDGLRQQYLNQSASCSVKQLLHWLSVLNTADQRYKTSNNNRLLVEFSLVQLTQLPQASSPEKKNTNNLESEPAPKKVTAPVKYKTDTTSATAEVQEGPNKKTPPPAPKPVSASPLTKANKMVGTQKKGKGTGFSLSALTKKNNPESNAEEIDETPEVNYGNAVFTQKDLERVWKQFSKNYQDNKTFYTVLLNGPELLENNKVLIKLDNKVQESFIKDFKPELLAYLRENLGNSGIFLEQEIRKMEEIKSVYTPDEKFKHMSEKNPMLLELKKRLDLNY